MQQRIFERINGAGIPITESEAQKLGEYLELMQRWNRVYNLTGVTEPDEMIDRHLLESLAFKPYLRGSRVADIGSGAGLPGIPLAITVPDIRMSLVESRAKRARFLRHVQGELVLSNVSVEHSRAEDLTPVAPFDTVLARAVKSPPELVKMTAHLLAPDGILLVLTKAAYGEVAGEPGDRFSAHCVEDPVTKMLRGSLVLIETTDSH